MTPDANKTAVSGKQASLSCKYGLPEKVEQVLWKKTLAHGSTREVASYAKHSDASIDEGYADRMGLSHSLSDSRLTMRPVRTEDEGCYICEFHTHADSVKTGTICLTVFGMFYTFSKKNSIIEPKTVLKLVTVAEVLRLVQKGDRSV